MSIVLKLALVMTGLSFVNGELDKLTSEQVMLIAKGFGLAVIVLCLPVAWAQSVMLCQLLKRKLKIAEPDGIQMFGLVLVLYVLLVHSEVHNIVTSTLKLTIVCLLAMLIVGGATLRVCRDNRFTMSMALDMSVNIVSLLSGKVVCLIGVTLFNIMLSARYFSAELGRVNEHPVLLEVSFWAVMSVLLLHGLLNLMMYMRHLKRIRTES